MSRYRRTFLSRLTKKPGRRDYPPVTISGAGPGTAVDAPKSVAFACPECGWTGEFDSRFTQWCEKCGFNADPAPPNEGKRRSTRRTARERARAEEQCERLSAAQELRPTSATG